jgi:hypothetical protein
MTKSSAPSRKSLVLVIGAGASKEVNLPVGEELKQAIASSLSFRVVDSGYRVEGGDSKIMEALRQLVQQPGNQRGEVSLYLQAASLIKNAMPQAQSIDNFIDSHRSDVRIAQCGKLAIASCILKAERGSALRVDRSNIYNKINFVGVSNTWFNGLFQLIVQSCQQEDIAARLEKLAVISFNYDRCLEHFLHGALQNYYSMSPEQATAAMSHLQVFHPYGTVGALPWSDPSRGVEYGAEPSSHQLNALAAQIRTFTESTDPTSSDIVTLRSTISSAERMAYLGFAFHPLNLELLYGVKAKKASASDARVYATALGLSDSDARLIEGDLEVLGGYSAENVNLHKTLTAAALFREYTRSLTLQ